MPTTACTDNYYNTKIIGYVPGTGDTTGEVVTFTAPKPIYTDDDGQSTKQCNAVTLGGFNGLNS